MTINPNILKVNQFSIYPPMPATPRHLCNDLGMCHLPAAKCYRDLPAGTTTIWDNPTVADLRS